MQLQFPANFTKVVRVHYAKRPKIIPARGMVEVRRSESAVAQKPSLDTLPRPLASPAALPRQFIIPAEARPRREQRPNTYPTALRGGGNAVGRDRMGDPRHIDKFLVKSV